MKEGITGGIVRIYNRSEGSLAFGAVAGCGGECATDLALP